MKTFIKHFIRIAPGTWTCIKGGELDSPKGHIRVAVGTTITLGTNVMGIDLAAMLEEQFQTDSSKH